MYHRILMEEGAKEGLYMHRSNLCPTPLIYSVGTGKYAPCVSLNLSFLL